MQLKIKDNNKLINCFYSETITGLNKAIYQIDTDNKNIIATLYINEKKISCDELLGLKELDKESALIKILAQNQENSLLIYPSCIQEDISTKIINLKENS